VNVGERPATPFPVEEDGEEEQEEAHPEPNDQHRLAAQSQMEDFTRNIQRKKDKELQDLQFVGGDGSTSAQPVSVGQKVGRNDPCPCGSGKKFKKCHGQAS
jgi:preprotein translocase subunit SecA